ncbi:uncharacterized protein [Coffea arabica]|uniref:Retrotransposon gag domain-containing protein n=1 Tax=Coffea arabica TaxID=13443 RepID=A0ABM4X3L0_COFAR
MEAGRRRKGRQPRQPRNERVDNGSDIDQNAEPSAGRGNDQMGQVLHRMTDILELLVAQQGQSVGRGNQEIGEDRALERFQKFFPPKFSGGPNPDIAENWLENIRNIFDALDYSEEREVNFAVFQLEGPARAWWNVIRNKWEREQTPRTWMNFVLEFNGKFLPPLVQEKREDDFIKLRQGTLSVAEYETRFTKLSTYAPELVATERKRIRRFIQGLDLEIQDALAAAQVETLSDALEKAQRVEITKSQLRAFQARKRDASDSTLGENGPPPKVRKEVDGVGLLLPAPLRIKEPKGTMSRETSVGQTRSKKTSQTSQVTTPRPICGYCGRTNHTEVNCWLKGRKCMGCGSTSHKVHDCPRRYPRETTTQQGNGTVPRQVNGRRNRPVASERTPDMITSHGSRLSEISEGMNFEDEILLRRGGCENPEK